MKRMSWSTALCVVPWVAVVGMTAGSVDGADAAKVTSKHVKTKVRAQNADQPAVSKSKADDEVFDREKTDDQVFDTDLSAATRQTTVGPQAPCIQPSMPNCTDIFGKPLNSDGTTSSTASSTPNQNSASTMNNLTDPNANSRGEGLGTSQMASTVAPFIGDFFGGSLVGNTVGAPTTAQFAQDPNNSNEYFRLIPVGNLPNHYQTIGGPILVNSAPGQPVTIHNPFGSGNLTLVATGDHSVLFNPPATTQPTNPVDPPIFGGRINLNTGGIDPAVATGRTKLAEGASPIPRDRVFFNYSFFDDAQLTSPGVPVNRYTPGFEKTFFNGNASVEVRTPFASSLATNLDVSGIANPTDMQFGNVTIYTKALLYQTPTYAYSGGLGFTLPTANNINIYNGTQQLLHIENDSVHLLPFLGGVYTPNDRYYAQGFLQFDMDTNGNKVYSFTNTQGETSNNRTGVGTFRDAAFLYASVGTGYWIFKTTTPTRWGLTAISPVGELHYNRSLQSGNLISQQTGFNAMNMPVISTVYGQSFSNIEVLNAVAGTNFLFGRNRILTLGYTTPLGMGVDKQFAGEFRVMFNWYFGGGNSSPMNRVGRVQF